MADQNTEVPLISYSDALQSNNITHGYLKCRLVHMRDRSFVLPDVLMASGRRRRFYSPQFFNPNQIAFFGGDGSADFCRIRVEVIGRVDLEIVFFRRGLFKRCSDNSFIYKCAFKVADGAPAPPGQGEWRRRGQKFEMTLYHHTNAAGEAGIKNSSELWSSPWNIQGSKKLKNISYGYFTSIPRIMHEFHLWEIAMASSGTAYFLPTNAPYDFIFATALDIPRQTAQDRDRSLKFWVDVESLSPSHLWLHRPMARPAYYEIVLPKVFRIGVEPGKTIPISGTAISIAIAECKTFNYAIVGDADTHDGLVAPYHEEETVHLAKIDSIPGETEIIGRWFSKQNSQLFPDIAVELAEFIEHQTSTLLKPDRKKILDGFSAL